MIKVEGKLKSTTFKLILLYIPAEMWRSAAGGQKNEASQ